MKTSYEADKEVLLRRLRRMEGQVRGIQQMIEDNRYCLEVVQQINALTAAAREVSIMVIEDHLRECVTQAVSDGEQDKIIAEMMNVLRKTLRS